MINAATKGLVDYRLNHSAKASVYVVCWVLSKD